MIDRALVIDLYTHQGLSTRQIASLLGCSKSRVFEICSDVARTQSEAAIIRQPATSKHWRSSRNAARKVWKRANGTIPQGFHIHHKNGDFTDNRLENLECLDAVSHAYLHMPKNPVPRHLRPARKAYMREYLQKWRAKQC